MKILFAASEAVPFIKSGGLADVAGSLSNALQQGKKDSCRVVIPLYKNISSAMRKGMKFLTSFEVPLGWRNQYCGVYEKTHDGVTYYFLDNEYYFLRPGLYGYYDDAERFAFFSKAVCEMIQYVDYKPDVLHCNDWQTGLVPAFLNIFYRHIPEYQTIKTVFTIHNIQYQGRFDLSVRYDVLGLPAHAQSIVEYHQDVNFMKAGIEQSNFVTTVSPSYAKEILNPWYSYGLDSLLQEHQGKLVGILNGIDTKTYNPETDSEIVSHYSLKDFNNKSKNKTALQKELKLELLQDTMMIAMITRLVPPKGIDFVRAAFDTMIGNDIQFVLLGNGDKDYEDFFRAMQKVHPNKVAAILDFNEPLSRKIYSGADVFLMPSVSEPCGLSQMIALRYGTIPVVHSTGGLKDSVFDFGGENGNGYDFINNDPGDMLFAIERALEDFKKPELWKKHIQAAMKMDYSWQQSAQQYLSLYENL